MPHNITKPIVLICGSRSINSFPLGRFIKKESVAAIISGGATGIDAIAAEWAKSNRVEYIEMLPNYKIWKDRAPLVRDEEMVNMCDVVIAFWDGKSKGTKYTLDYAQRIGRRCIVHLVQQYD